MIPPDLVDYHAPLAPAYVRWEGSIESVTARLAASQPAGTGSQPAQQALPGDNTRRQCRGRLQRGLYMMHVSPSAPQKILAGPKRAAHEPTVRGGFISATSSQMGFPRPTAAAATA